jgi:hypothetical protein
VRSAGHLSCPAHADAVYFPERRITRLKQEGELRRLPRC